MQAIDVVPLEDGALPPTEKSQDARKPLGKRQRRPLRDDEIESAVDPDQAALFLRAMDNLGMDANGNPDPRRSRSGARDQSIANEPIAEAQPTDDRLSSLSNATDRYQPSAEERRLFEQAMAALDRAPDKDAPRPTPAPRPIRRLTKPPRARHAEVDATLDLHRERQARAIERLRDFLVGTASSGAKRVLVITGKGNHSEDGQGILRRAVESWLIRYGTPWVARFSEAPRELGGRGAWLIELRP